MGLPNLAFHCSRNGGGGGEEVKLNGTSLLHGSCPPSSPPQYIHKLLGTALGGDHARSTWQKDDSSSPPHQSSRGAKTSKAKSYKCILFRERGRQGVPFWGLTHHHKLQLLTTAEGNKGSLLHGSYLSMQA